MLDWKNVSLLLIPIITTLLGSSFLIPYLINELPDIITNPDLEVEKKSSSLDRESFYLEKNENISLEYTITNTGSQTAEDVAVSIFHPFLNDSHVLSNSVDIPSSSITNITKDYFNQKPWERPSIDNILKVNGNKMELPSIGVGSKIDLIVLGKINKFYDYDPNKFPCIMNITYGNGSVNYDCNAPVQDYRPYLYSSIAVPVILYIILVNVVLISIGVYFYVRQRKFDDIRKNSISELQEEFDLIRKSLSRNIHSQIAFKEDKWNLLSSETRHHIFGLECYPIFQELLIALKERSSILSSIRKKNPDLSVEPINKIVLDLCNKLSDRDWQQCGYDTRSVTPFMSYLLIIPMIVLSSITLWYIIEAQLYYLFIESLADHNYSIWMFFFLTYLTRIVATFCLLYAIIKLNKAYFDRSEVSNNGNKHIIKRTIISSISITGFPSLFLILVIHASFSTGPIDPLLIAIMIPAIDLFRFTMAVFVIRAKNTLYLLHKILIILMSIISLLYVSLYFQIQDIEWLPIIKVVNPIIISVLIIEFAILFLLVKRPSRISYYVGIANSVILCIFLIPIMDNFQLLTDFFEGPLFVNDMYNFQLLTDFFEGPLFVNDMRIVGFTVLAFHLIYIIISIIIITNNRFEKANRSKEHFLKRIEK